MFSLKKIIRNFNLETIYLPKECDVETYTFDAQGTTNGYYEFFDVTDHQTIALFGSEDLKVFDKMEDLDEFFTKLSTTSKIIIVSKTFDTKKIIEHVKANNLAIFRSPYRKVDLKTIINSYISYKIAERQTVHGSLVNIYGEGVLIMGESGIGKSEVVIDLINRNHAFVADDAVEIFRHNSDFMGTPSKITKDFIELRGIGIINAKKTFGMKNILKKTKINLVIELVNLSKNKDIDRLGTDFQKFEILDGEIDKLQIPVSAGRSIASIVETAVTVYKHKKYDSYSAVEDITNKHKES